MPGHASVAGRSFRVLNIGGQGYRLASLTIGDYADLEMAVMQARPNLVTEAAKACVGIEDEGLRAAIISSALDRAELRRHVSREEINDFTRTLLGQTTTLWLLLRHYHGDQFPDPRSTLVLLDGIIDELGPIGLDKLFQDMADAKEGELKNSAGPINPDRAEAEAGQRSTSFSPANTAGHPTS